MNKKVLIGIIATVCVVVISVVLFLVLNNKTEVYTISFDSAGGKEVKSISIKEGDTLTLPEDPKREGYIFNGWVDKEDKMVNNGLVIKSNLELKATWIEESAKIFTVHFDSKGGSKVADIIVEEGTALKLPKNPTKEGYKFDKWVDKNEMPILDGALLSTEDITLYALWVKEENKNTDKPSNNNNKTDNNTNQTNNNNNNVNSNVEVESVSIENVETIVVKKTKELKATVKPDNATDKKLTWESSNKYAIKVDENGKITAVGIGKSIITAKASNGKSASITVESTVSRIDVTISGSEYISTYGPNKQVKLVAEVSPNGHRVSWSAPDATGGSGAWLETNGNTITINASENANFGTNTKKIPVYAYIGSKQSATKYIYVEPKLQVTPSVNCSESSGKYICGNLKGKTVTFSSNLEISDWIFNGGSAIKDENRTSKGLLLQFYDSCSNGYGVDLKVRSNAGQIIEYTLNC